MNHIETVFVWVALGLFSSCGLTPVPLNPVAAAKLRQQHLTGEHIYTGLVVPDKADSPSFVYQRRVEQTTEDWISTHLAFRADTKEAIVGQWATHSSRYVLRHFEEIHGQTGVVGAVQVGADGSLTFTLTRSDEREYATEGAGNPVVVGPTLFGYILNHWEELVQGATLAVRFAAVDQARSYEFEIRQARSDGDITVMSFCASSFWVRLGIDTMYIAFNTRSRKVLWYQGRVPVRYKELDSMDARVSYDFVAATYR